MLITERKFWMINIVNIFFSENLEDINIPQGDILTYYSYKNWGKINGFQTIQTRTTTIDLNQGIERIWNKLNRHHKRHIQRAEKNGIKVARSDKYQKFHKMYKEFLIQKGYAGPFGVNIISSQFMKKYGVLFVAEYQDEIIGGNLFFHDENNVLSSSIAYQLPRNTVEKNKLIHDANCYIHWEAMQYFNNLDIKTYHFGGFNHFSRSFGGTVIPQYNYMKFNSHLYKSLFQLGNLFLKT